MWKKCKTKKRNILIAFCSPLISVDQNLIYHLIKIFFNNRLTFPHLIVTDYYISTQLNSSVPWSHMRSLRHCGNKTTTYINIGGDGLIQKFLFISEVEHRTQHIVMSRHYTINSKAEKQQAEENNKLIVEDFTCLLKHVQCIWSGGMLSLSSQWGFFCSPIPSNVTMNLF